MRARILLVSTLLLTSLLAQAGQQSSGRLEVVIAGRELSFDESKELSIKFWLQQLMLSALYRDVIQNSSREEWTRQLFSQSRIHCTYPTMATLAIPERRTLTFDEALVSVTGGYPDFVFIRRGAHVLRLGKYDPWVFHKLVSEAGMSAPPAVERGLF
jgi:hypothetical protein